MIRAVALIFLFWILPLRAEDTRYSAADLKALEKTGQWEELLKHLDDVPNAEKNEKWEAMGLKAAEKYLKSLDAEEEPFAAITAANQLEKRFRFLHEAKSFRKTRRNAALKGLEHCFALSYTGTACIDKMMGFVSAERDGSELAFRAGKVVAHSGRVAEAAPFFKKFLDGKTERVECQDEDVANSTIAALELPGDNPLVAEGREIASSLCPEKMRPILLKALGAKKKGSDFARNSCRFLKEGGSMGKAEEACRR